VRVSGHNDFGPFWSGPVETGSKFLCNAAERTTIQNAKKYGFSFHLSILMFSVSEAWRFTNSQEIFWENQLVIDY
jgi:hypothetical protein